MKKRYVIGLIIVFLPSTASIAQNTSGCGTPPECYAKAAATLNDTTKQIRTLQDRVSTLEQKIADQRVLINLLKEVDIPRIQKEIENPTAQVGMYSCQKPIHTVGNEPGYIDIIFTLADCGNVVPKRGWTYTPMLVGTDICGGFSEYRISADPFQPTIRFWGRFCSSGSSVSVNYIGFNPKAF